MVIITSALGDILYIEDLGSFFTHFDTGLFLCNRHEQVSGCRNDH